MFVIDTTHGPGIVVACVLVTLAVPAWVLATVASGRLTAHRRRLGAVCGTFASR